MVDRNLPLSYLHPKYSIWKVEGHDGWWAKEEVKSRVALRAITSAYGGLREITLTQIPVEEIAEIIDYWEIPF